MFHTLSALILWMQDERLHFSLQQTVLTAWNAARRQRHVLGDSWPLQGRCKEKSWALVAVSRPGCCPVDNMLPVPGLSGSLCQSICFPLLMKAARRTWRRLPFCRPFFCSLTCLNVSSGGSLHLFTKVLLLFYYFMKDKLSFSNGLIKLCCLLMSHPDVRVVSTSGGGRAAGVQHHDPLWLWSPGERSGR